MKILPFQPTTILNYGATGSGKTSGLSQLARYIFKATGGIIDKDGKTTGGLRTRLYLSDNGDTGPLQADIDLGLIEVIDVRMLPHPFLWALKVAAGQVPDISGEDEKAGILKGAWKKVDNSHIGLFAFDSLTSIAERMFDDLSAKAALGINIGGEGAYNFVDGSESWGKITVGSSNRIHYNVVQQRVSLMADHLTQLASRENALVYITCAEDRGEGETSRVPIIGPKTKGKALTDQLPRLFGLTFHSTVEVTAANKEPLHKLWMVSHPDKTAGNVTALANRRLPMLTPGHPLYNELPAFLEPSDLVKAITISQDVLKKAKELVIKELMK